MISEDRLPPLYGLVLAGGRSTRMGEDKGSICWHGRPQRYHAADMLATVCDKVFISCRPDQVAEIDNAYATLPDSVDGGGPAVAILSAFHSHSHVAWLIVACDLPLLNVEMFQQLASVRSSQNIATAFRSPTDSLPEPLVAIWEPSAFPIVSQSWSDGIRCPRKILMKNGYKVLIIDSEEGYRLTNANTPSDRKIAVSLIAEELSERKKMR